MKFTKLDDRLGRALLFGGILAASALPYILHTVVLIVTERSLSDFAYGFCNVLGGIVALLLIYLAVGFMGLTKLWDFVSCMLNFMWVAVFMQLAEHVIFLKLEAYIYDYVWLIPVVYGVVVIIALFFMATAVLNGVRRPRNMLITMLMWAFYMLVQLLVQKLLELCVPMMKAAFVTNLAIILVFAIVDTLIIYIILVYARNVTDNWQRKESSPIQRNVPMLVFIVVALIACGVLKSSEDPEDMVIGDLQEELLQGDLALFHENLELAIAFYERALNRMEAWKFALDAEYDVELLNRLVTSKEDLQINVIYWEKTGDVEAMEDYLLYDAVNLELAVRYLNMLAMKEDGELVTGMPDEAPGEEVSNVDTTEGEESPEKTRQQAIKEDIISLMIANNYFCDTTLFIADIMESKDELLETFEEYGKAQLSKDVLLTFAETGKTGEVTQEKVNQMLDYAEAHTDNLFLQRMAVVYGNALKLDHESHYARTVQAAIRYEKLFANSQDITREDKLLCKLNVAKWIMDLKDYRVALTYLEEVLNAEDNIEAINLAAQCFNQLGEVDKCREMTERLLEMDPENIQALNYCALAYLRQGDIDKALEYSMRICKIMENSEGETKHIAEVALYSMLQYMTVSDGTVGYKYQIYSKLNDEQKALVSSDQLFFDYIEAVYLCFNKRDFTGALERINAVLGSQGDLSQASYLKGAIYYGAKDYENAIQAYLDSIKVENNSPTVWYALATTYDALEQYEDAYEACLMVEKLLPDTDHGFDWYGVAIHNNRLMDALKRELGR